MGDRFALAQVLAVLKQHCRDDPAVGLAQRSVTKYKDVAQAIVHYILFDVEHDD